jgi:NTP pyrophosphatase (non-canonical NTP hydrolase)
MNDTQQSFSKMVAALVKPGQDILNSLSPEDCHNLHMIIGLDGEVGELTDALKKSIIYRKPLDKENVIEEIGDIMFYLEGLMQSLGITGQECIEANIKKLSVRYSEGSYSNAQASERADKALMEKLEKTYKDYSEACWECTQLSEQYQCEFVVAPIARDLYQIVKLED